MGTKTISIMDDVYDLMLRHKKSNESFSELFRRQFRKKGKISECAGLWSHLSDKQIGDMKQSIKELRKNTLNSMNKKLAAK
ncbi:MAG: antitoxin VapB family protein [Nanoarchaeota archaeon]|nr:antitoxin VapB family protein [Nanoarchaeota archaeon]MBU1005776.1 antitoxin VapB family protein [Nanoarchaeota archaeon]MBU1946647.1 antitoxin VapB family protein [Nanoarchaeota archaeon]